MTYRAGIRGRFEADNVRRDRLDADTARLDADNARLVADNVRLEAERHRLYADMVGRYANMGIRVDADQNSVTQSDDESKSNV